MLSTLLFQVRVRLPSFPWALLNFGVKFNLVTDFGQSNVRSTISYHRKLLKLTCFLHSLSLATVRPLACPQSGLFTDHNEKGLLPISIDIGHK